jgi:hypothetical protein
MGHRKRAALFCKDHKPDLTETGYLRNVAIDASTQEAALIKSHVHASEWEMTVEGEQSELVFPLEYFDVLLTEDYHKADVMYYEPLLVPVNNETPIEVSSEMFAGNTICFQKNVKFRKTLDKITSAFLFYKLFIEKRSIKNVAKELLDLYGVNEENGGEIIHDIYEFYERFQNVEYLPNNLESYD